MILIMKNNEKFSLAIAALDKKIATLNIKISKNLNNETLKNELSLLLHDRERLFKECDLEIIKNLINKYGSKKNG